MNHIVCLYARKRWMKNKPSTLCGLLWDTCVSFGHVDI